MELLQQHQTPQPLEVRIRVLDSQPDARRRGPQLCLAQEVFAATVAALGARLRGVGAPVILQVHLAHPGGGAVGELLAGGVEEALRRGEDHAR